MGLNIASDYRWKTGAPGPIPGRHTLMLTERRAKERANEEEVRS